MKQLTEAQKQALADCINGLAEDFKDIVRDTEAKPETTQHHYGDYGGIISSLSKGKAGTAKIIAAALIKAGANATGVTNGLNLLVLGNVTETAFLSATGFAAGGPEPRGAGG